MRKGENSPFYALVVQRIGRGTTDAEMWFRLLPRVPMNGGCIMFRCCLCGTRYVKEQDAVKCVNKCGRAAHQDGKFQVKESKHSEDISKVSFDFIEDAINDIYFLNIINLLDKLSEAGAPKSQVSVLRDKILKDWNDVDNNEHFKRYNELCMLAKIYGIKF